MIEVEEENGQEDEDEAVRSGATMAECSIAMSSFSEMPSKPSFSRPCWTDLFSAT